MLRLPEEFLLAIHQDHRTKRRVNHKYNTKPLYKEEANEFKEVRQLAYVLRAEGRISYSNKLSYKGNKLIRRPN